MRGKIASSKRTVVIGRYVTRQVNTIARLEIESPNVSIEILEGTPIHPIWLVDREDWIPLGELTEGESLRPANGRTVVRYLRLITVATPVYNIEVHRDHVYEVGQNGILVHNAGPVCVLVPTGAKRLGTWGEDRLAVFLRGAGTKPRKPIQTSMGNRYVDRMVKRVAHESKAGVDVKLTNGLWRQMLKDLRAIDDGLAKDAHWHFWQGATPEVLDALKSLNMRYTVH